jgi:23S rRNA (cytosine1962-C5)-methyltransferase
MYTLRLKPGREKSLLRRHPWVFASAIEKIEGSPEPGDTVRILSAAGDFLAWGAFSPRSQIRARAWSWEGGESIDAAFFERRLERALSLRKTLRMGETGALRLVHGESDGLPGLVVDRYGEHLVVQILACGAEIWRVEIVEALKKLIGIGNIFERSDADVRTLEGLPERVGVISGAQPPEKIKISENGIDFWVDLHSGHKTGFYLDQRTNRRLLRGYAEGRETLDCFSYTGGFLLNALRGGAQSVLAVDASQEALRLSRENVQLNGFPIDSVSWLEGDVFQVLRTLRDQGRSFDLVVLDPPKFAPTVSQAERAARGYKDINLLALKLLRPDGLLFTFSCSGGVRADLFQKIVAGAAEDAKVDAQMIGRMSQDSDHPVALSFPEGEYLKGLVIRRVV